MDVRLPNGVLIRGVPEGTTQEKLKRIAIKNNIAKPEDFAESGILPALQGGFERFVSSGKTALESLTGSPEEASVAGLKRQQDIASRVAPGADFGKVSKKYEKEGLGAAAKEVLQQIPTAAAEMAPAIGATLASGAAGAALGTATAGPVGTVVGGLAGAFLPSLVTRAGTNIEEQAAADLAEKKPVDINRTAAFGLAVPGAALDVAANTIPVLGRTAVAKLFPAAAKALNRGAVETAERIAKESLIKRAAKGTLENLAIQGVVQPAQVMLTRIQAGEDLLSPEAINQYGHAMYMAGLLSPIGAVGGIRERGQARTQLEQRSAMLDAARQKLFEASEAAKPTPDAPDLPMSALNVQRLLGVNLSEAGQIRRELYKRGDLIEGTGGGKRSKLFLNRERLSKAEEPVPPTTEVSPAPAEEAKISGFTGEQLLGPLTERTPEELAADQTVVPPPAAAPAEVLPTPRKRGGKKPAAEKITSPENLVFQAGAKLVKEMDEAGTPITPDTFGTALNSIVGEVSKLQVGHLLGALTRNNLLSKPDENRIRTYVPPVEVTPFKPTEVENAELPGRTEAIDVESVGRSMGTPVSGDETAVAPAQGNIERAVGDVGEPAAVRAAPKRVSKPALEEIAPDETTAVKPAELIEATEPITLRPQTIPEGERVPYNAQPSAPDVFTPSPEQARISTETIDSNLVPGRGIRRARARMEKARRAQEEQQVPPTPEEGVSQRYDSVAESLRAGNLGEALYRLREESSGKSPLSWLADKLLNVVEIKDDRTPLIKPQVERMVPVTKGKAQFNRASGRLEFIKPEPEQRFEPVYNKVTGKVEDIPTQPLAPPQKPFTLDDLPKPVSPFKKGAFGGAKVFVEGSADVRGQNKAVIDRLQREGKLAEYNPKTNTFYFTEAGLTDRVILHEMVHSATVGVMKKFLSGKEKELTDMQRQGAKEIVDIYNDTKAVLENKFKTAYENEYEFITYATTNEGFQRALSNFNAPKSFKTKLRSAWDSFTIAVAKMVGLDKFARTKLTEEPSLTQEIKRVKAADEMDNALLRVIDSVGDILTVPKAGVDVEPLAARRQGRRRQFTPVRLARSQNQQPLGSTQGTFIPATAKAKPTLASRVKYLFTRKGYEDAIINLQNTKRPWLVQDDSLQRMGELQRTGPGRNNTGEELTLAQGRQEVLEKGRIAPLLGDLGEAISQYAKKLKFKDVDDAAEHLGVLRMAANEQEKRAVKFLETVPLDDAPLLTLNNKPISPAAYRDALFDYVVQDKDLVSNGEVKQIRNQLEQLAQRYAKIGGKSRNDRVPSNSPDALDINAPHYQVVGYENSKLNAWRRVLAREMRQYGPEIRKVFDAIDAINEERIALEREANYWTKPTDNLKSLYGYKYYVPFKSMAQGTADLGFDLDTNSRAGTQYRQLEDKARGHQYEIANPVFQIVRDLHHASARAASAGVTETIKNQIAGPNPTLEGKLVERVSFADKYNGVQKQDLSKYNVFFHHLPDGTTEVYSLKDKRLVDGLNGFSRDMIFPLRVFNSITQLMGRQHTFYNLAFAPYNFFRDILTNSFNAAGKFGPMASAKIIGAVAQNTVESGLLTRAAKISWLYEKGDFAAIKNMKGAFAKNAYEYLVEQGGRGSYQKVFDIASVERQTLKRNKILSWKNFQQLFTTYADAFEFTSRVSAYGVIKNELTAQGKARGLNINDPVFKEGVKQGAASFTKNMFNYEQVGNYGRELGSLYMFARPSLTSAVRVMDVLLPAFQSVESAMEQGPSILRITDPADPNFTRAQAARSAFKANYAKEKKNATIMGMVLIGAGAAIYNWVLANAPSDNSGRNVTATDDMSMWTRNARIPMKFAGEGNDFMNAPWGFGLGAFAAFGAQAAAYAQGNQSFGSMMENLVPITLDSFIPLPAPRFSPREQPAAFVIDTVLPTAARPFVEFAMNTDSLGRRIYNDRINKYGDAYSGGQHVPQWARDFTAAMADKTAGFDIPWNMEPQTVAYLVNNYFDAVGKFTGAIYNLSESLSGNKDFDPKTDSLIVGSFIGKRASVDQAKFADLVPDIERRIANLSAYENRAGFDRYIQSHPEDYLMTKLYSSLVNGPLKDLRTQENQINSGRGLYSGLDERAKQLLLRENRMQTEQLKGDFVRSIEAIKASAGID